MKTDLAVPADLAALKPVRDVLRDAIGQWHTPVECDRLLLLVTEILTNAVHHGTPPISVSMDWDGVRLHVEVFDTGRAVPVLGDPSPEDADGRGMWLLERMASSWGVVQHDQGKSVWFELLASGGVPIGVSGIPSCPVRR